MILGIFDMFPIFMELTLRRQKTLFFPFMFQGPKRRPNNLKIYEHQYSEGTRLGSEGIKQMEPRGRKEVGPCGLCTWPRGTPQVGPRRSVVVELFSTD